MRPTRPSTRPDHRRRSRGQGIVEFALILPVLMVLLLLTIDMGRLYFGWVATQNMARIAANYAADYPAGPWGSGSTYQAQIDADATTINCIPPASWPAPTFPDGATNIGDRAQVSLTCGFHLLTPLLSAVVGNPINLGATAVFPIKAGVIGGVPIGNTLPTPTPTATATPTPTPTPTPKFCTVPTLIGTHESLALAAWTQAGFVPSNITVSLGTGDYIIASESPKNSDGASKLCDKFTLTVGP
jgi:TadE-like protein